MRMRRFFRSFGFIFILSLIAAKVLIELTSPVFVFIMAMLLPIPAYLIAVWWDRRQKRNDNRGDL